MISKLSTLEKLQAIINKDGVRLTAYIAAVIGGLAVLIVGIIAPDIASDAADKVDVLDSLLTSLAGIISTISGSLAISNFTKSGEDDDDLYG